MSIATFLQRTCTDTAVYWGNPQNDGQGGFTYDAPVEIQCRWEDTQQVLLNKTGNEITCRAVVYVLQDLEEEGVLWKGTLAALPDNDPKEVEKAASIKRFDKIPALGSTTEYLRKAFLTPSLSFGGF